MRLATNKIKAIEITDHFPCHGCLSNLERLVAVFLHTYSVNYSGLKQIQKPLFGEMGKKPTAAGANFKDEKLHEAARSGDMKAVQEVCSADPLAVNSRDRHSRTPLHLAAWSGHAEVVNYLCKNKADIGAAAMDDMGAIHFAAQKGQNEVIKILLASGISIKSCNRKGITALHYAAQGSHLELVKHLVKKGANLDAKNKSGKTAVDIASSEEVRNILVKWKNGSGKSVGVGGDKREKG